MNQKCENCWWYCHQNGKCYVSPASRQIGDDYAVSHSLKDLCWQWKPDGLEDWEREVPIPIGSISEVFACHE